MGNARAGRAILNRWDRSAGDVGVERRPSPLATTRRGGEEEENIRAARSTPRVALSLVASRARARASDHPSIARACARSVVPNVRSFHPRSPRCRTYGGLEDVGRCYRVREWCFPMDGILLNGIRTQNHLRGGRCSPGDVDTSPRHRGDSRRVVIQENQSRTPAHGHRARAREGRARSPSVAGGG